MGSILRFLFNNGGFLEWEKGQSTATLPNNGQEKNNFISRLLRILKYWSTFAGKNKLLDCCKNIPPSVYVPACILVTQFLIQVACMKAVFSLIYAVAPIAIDNCSVVAKRMLLCCFCDCTERKEFMEIIFLMVDQVQ